MSDRDAQEARKRADEARVAQAGERWRARSRRVKLYRRVLPIVILMLAGGALTWTVFRTVMSGVERKASEAWARLCVKKPSAAAVLHHLVANMGHQNAVVVSQKTLAQITGRSVDTVKRALRDLVAERWVSVVKLNGPGTVAAYVVNDRVAWGQPRDQLRLSVFSATIVADRDDQDEALLGHADLRRIPTLYPGEQQLPTGPGEDPPSQPNIDGLEPNLPAIQAGDAADRAGLRRTAGRAAARCGPPTGRALLASAVACIGAGAAAGRAAPVPRQYPGTE